MQQNILDQPRCSMKLIEKRLQDEHYRVSEANVLAAVPERSRISRGRTASTMPTTARLALAQMNKSRARILRRDPHGQLLINQLQQGIGGSYFLTRAEAQRLFNLENEEREVQYVQLAADKFAGTEPIDDAAVKAYYDKNGDRFMTTESVALEYAELRLEQLATQVAPTEADLQKLYDDNRASYVLDERRRARHIVIPGVNGDDDAAAALKKAESVAGRGARRQGFRRARQEIFHRRHRGRGRRARLRAEERFRGSDRRHAVRHEGG